MSKKRLTTITLIALLSVALLFVFAQSVIGGDLRQMTQAFAAADWTSAYEGSYYNEIDNSLTGQALRDDLARLITVTHTKQTSYKELKTVFQTTDADQDKNGNVIWFYSGTSVPFSAFGSGGGSTNREHVWPKNGGKAFPEESGPGSDAHHLRPLEANLNSARGNKSFGEVAQIPSNAVAQNGSVDYENPCYADSEFFYPGKGYRGATARILFYLQTRWGGAQTAANQYGLTFVDAAGYNKTIGKISDLLKWHLEEPPTDEEIRRNEAVFRIQGNRNPFIDRPEYAAMIYCHTDGFQSIDGTALGNKLVQVVADNGGNYNNNRSGDVNVKFDAKSISLLEGNGLSLTSKVTVSPSNQNVKFTSSNTEVVQIEENRAFAVSAGTATITAICADDSAKTATMVIIVVSEREKAGFAKLVNGIANADSSRDKFAAISSALSVYNVLSEEEKAEFAEACGKLEQYVLQYNSDVKKHNDDFSNAVKSATFSAAFSVAAFVALCAFGKRFS